MRRAAASIFNSSAVVSALLWLLVFVLFVRGFFAIDYLFVKSPPSWRSGLESRRWAIDIYSIESLDKVLSRHYSGPSVYSEQTTNTTFSTTRSALSYERYPAANFRFCLPRFERIDYPSRNALPAPRPPFPKSPGSYVAIFVPGMRGWQLTIPDWATLLAFTVLPAIWYWRYRLNRFPPGFCSICGYDLRATTDRCPECGKTVEKVS
jgi:hypothetical protein